MGGPPFPSWLEGKSFQGCLLVFPGTVWDFSPTRPPCKRYKCSPCMTWSGNFIIRLGTMPHFQEGLKLNQWTRAKCKTRLMGPVFLLPSWDFSPLPSLRGLLFSVRLKLHVLRCIVSGRTPRAQFLLIRISQALAALPGRWRGLAGMWRRS